MNKTAGKRLRKVGFVETTVSEFLGLSPAEEALIEARLALTKKVRQTRSGNVSGGPGQSKSRT